MHSMISVVRGRSPNPNNIHTYIHTYLTVLFTLHAILMNIRGSLLMRKITVPQQEIYVVQRIHSSPPPRRASTNVFYYSLTRNITMAQQNRKLALQLIHSNSFFFWAMEISTNTNGFDCWEYE